MRNRTSFEKPKSCLIKVYDDQVRQFKLNDNVTFIGILEIQRQEESRAKKGDEEMKDESSRGCGMYDDYGAEFNELGSSGIPNEQTLPHLHAISFRLNETTSNP